MKLLVTGGAGYLGSEVLRQASERGWDVVATYLFEKDGWVQELTKALAAPVDFQMYRADSEYVQRYCRRASVIIWPLSGNQ